MTSQRSYYLVSNVKNTLSVPKHGTIRENLVPLMQKKKYKHGDVLTAIFARPVSASIKWAKIERLFIELGAKISEREGSRVAVELFGQVQVYHRPHPSPETDKGAVASIRKWLETNGVTP
jgi:hypothetical protein